MGTKIFINLPVNDLKRSQDFYKALNFDFNHQFTDARAACLIVNDSSSVMLMTRDFFKSFIKKPVSDAHKETSGWIVSSRDSRQAVDDMVEAAIKAGGSEIREAKDLGFMYSRAFEDPDGHIWVPMWMDPAHV